MKIALFTLLFCGQVFAATLLSDDTTKEQHSSSSPVSIADIEPQPSMGNWKQLQTIKDSDSSPYKLSILSMVFNPQDNAPYLLYDYGGHATIVKFDGKSFLPVGEENFSKATDSIEEGVTGSNDASFILNPKTNDLYSIYYYSSISRFEPVYYGISVMKYDGKIWSIIKKIEHAYNGSITINSKENTVYVAYSTERDNPKNHKIKIMKLKDGKWQLVSSHKASTSMFDSTLLKYNEKNDLLYLVYSPKHHDTSVMTFDGKKWLQLGSSLHNIYNVSLAFHPDSNQPYLAYESESKPHVAYRPDINIAPQDAIAPTTASIVRFNGKDWEPVSAVSFGPTDMSILRNLKFYFNPVNKLPYLSFEYWTQDYPGDSFKQKIVMFDGKNWAGVGTTITIDKLSCNQAPEIAFSNDGKVYMAYTTHAQVGDLDCTISLASLEKNIN